MHVPMQHFNSPWGRYARHIWGGEGVGLRATVYDDELKVQGVWQYLEPIFGSDDIMRQMPKEGALFKKQDGMWRDNVNKVKADVRVLVVADMGPRHGAGLLRCLHMDGTGPAGCRGVRGHRPSQLCRGRHEDAGREMQRRRIDRLGD